MTQPIFSNLGEWQRELQQRAGKRATLLQRFEAHQQAIETAAAELARLKAVGTAAAARQQEKKLTRLKKERDTTSEALSAWDDAFREVLGQGIARDDPLDAGSEVPLLLLPVRVETRFSADGRHLRVRIFPDDIHIDGLDRRLSEPEYLAGTTYWNQVWNGSATAWRDLVDVVGASRATWVVHALRPTNLDRQGAATRPQFTERVEVQRSFGVARLLPDAFTIVAVQGNERSVKTGQAILPEVPVEVFGRSTDTLRDVQGVKVAPGAEWLIDYEAAERIGMAVTLPLKQPNGRVDRLYVVGVRASLDPARSAEELEDLLLSHRCTEGLGLIPQGTATNNTDEERAGWQRQPVSATPVATDSAPAPESDAGRVAAALGINGHVLAGVEHANGREQVRAGAMNIALWGPSWGGFLEKVNRVTRDGATLSDRTREAARVFHRDFVRARGPLPALRVGDQPYGLLPVSALEHRWRPDAGDAFVAGLLPLLERLRQRWRKCLPNVPRVGESGSVDDTLRELLGSSPVSLGLRVRPVLSNEMAQLGSSLSEAAKTDDAVERLIDELIFEEVIANASLVHPTGSLGESRPLSLPLVHESDPAFIDALLAGSTMSVESVFQALVSLAWDRAERSEKQESANDQSAEIVKAATHLSLVERDSILALAQRVDTAAPAEFFAQAERVRTRMGALRVSHLELQPIPAVSRSFGELSLAATSKEGRSNLAMLAAEAWLSANGRKFELRDALTELRGTSFDERRILLAETLDLASHRLDAWLTAVVEHRRQQGRAKTPNGILVGAYAWVERIEPNVSSRSQGGFVHAPSLAHAATAAVLRSAYLSHNHNRDGSGAFAIDLPSARVRLALHLLDGVRQGQSLAALLGYQVERGIQEANLQRLILSLRTLAPYSQGKLSDRGATDGGRPAAAAQVLDGLDLLEKYQGKVANWSAAEIRRRLDHEPAGNAYYSGNWPKLTANEWADVESVMLRAIESLDAVSDLLLAESVHQWVSGNSVRAAANLDAASSGDSVAPEPEVVATPFDGAPYTHRLLLLAGEGPAWQVEQPRATAEPRLEAWAAARLGSANTVVVGNDQRGRRLTLAHAKICALDLIYESHDRPSFEARLRSRLTGLAEDSFWPDVAGEGWPAKLRPIAEVFECAVALRSLLVHARPARRDDLRAPNTPGRDAEVLTEVRHAHERASVAHEQLKLRCTQLESVLAVDPLNADVARKALDGLSDFGLGRTEVPDDQLPTLAAATMAAAAGRVQSAEAVLRQPVTAETVVEAGKTLFGEGFWILPSLPTAELGEDWTAALHAPPTNVTPSAIHRFLTEFASVRDGARRALEATLVGDATGKPWPWQVVQVASLGGTPSTGWVGAALPPDQPTSTASILNAVVTGTGATIKEDLVCAALVLDEWIDVSPIRERRGEGDDAPVDERVTSGISFNAASPSARAPQAMLLAISPDGARWTTDALVDTLAETYELAQLRGVTLERTNGIARIIPALYEQSWSLQGEKVLNFQVATEAAQLKHHLAFVRENPS